MSLGSGKNLFWIPDPGVKKALDPGSANSISYVLPEKIHCRTIRTEQVQIRVSDPDTMN